MSPDWFDNFDDDGLFSEEPEEAFYCPYTNAAECALLTKGLQPQELCLALECAQMKVVQRNSGSQRRDKAA